MDHTFLGLFLHVLLILLLLYFVSRTLETVLIIFFSLSCGKLQSNSWDGVGSASFPPTTNNLPPSNIALPGFEPGSNGPEPFMLDRYTTGLPNSKELNIFKSKYTLYKVSKR